jgi:hypothetical protein
MVYTSFRKRPSLIVSGCAKSIKLDNSLSRSIIETLVELNAEARAIMLFQFKKEIEEYHNLNYLREELEAKEFNEKLFLESKKNDLE